MYPPELKYTKDHEWIRVSGTQGQVGITDYAQQQLGDVVFVDLPEIGNHFAQGDQFGSIESVKAVSDLYCPVSGTIVEVNSALIDHPETVNADPYGTWIIIVTLSNTNELRALLEADGYGEFIT